MSKLLRYPVDREATPGYIVDVQDATIWGEKHKAFGDRDDEDGIHHMAVALTGDATETKGDSLTPILLRLLNLPPWIRDRMQQMIMVLLFPKGVKHEMCLAPLLWELAKYKPGENGEDLLVFDGTADTTAGVRLWLAFCGVTISPPHHLSTPPPHLCTHPSNRIPFTSVTLTYSMTRGVYPSTVVSGSLRASRVRASGVM